MDKDELQALLVRLQPLYNELWKEYPEIDAFGGGHKNFVTQTKSDVVVIFKRHGVSEEIRQKIAARIHEIEPTVTIDFIP